MIKKIIVSALLLSSIATSDVLTQPIPTSTKLCLSVTGNHNEIRVLDDDLVEVKYYATLAVCSTTSGVQGGVPCDIPPTSIDTLSHLRMMNELITNYKASNFAGVIAPSQPRYTDSLCIADGCLNGANRDIDISIQNDFYDNLDTSFTLNFYEEQSGLIQLDKVLFFSEAAPQSLDDFGINQDYCPPNTLDVNTPGKFIVQNDTIYQEGQPGLSIPLDEFLKIARLPAPSKLNEPATSQPSFDPDSHYQVVSIEGKTLFYGIGSKALYFLNHQNNSEQLRLIPTNRQ